jgi:hypothetical protein
MTTTILPELTRSNVDRLWEAVQSREVLKDLDWTEIFTAYVHVSEMFNSLIKRVHNRVERGATSRWVISQTSACVGIAGRALDLFNVLQAVLGADRIPDEVREAANVFEQGQAELAPLLAVAARPLPPIPDEVLKNAGKGPYVRLEEMRRRRGEAP